MKKTLALFVGLICMICVQAQIPSTQGTEFWLTFLYNHQSTATTNLILSAKNATTGTVSNPNTGWSTSFSIPAQGRVEVSIPNAQCYITASESILNKGILVLANDTISVYAANYYAYTFDATNILPIQALGDEHLVATYSGQYNGSEFAIVATQNGTIVDITPSVYTLGGHSAGVTYSVTLNKGQVYQVISSSATGDLSGSKVVARDCKKIAVFAGCRCTNIPSSCPYCDHIVEQTWPVFTWGKEFVVTNSLTRTQDRVRVTAANNGTQVYKDGSYLTTINAGVSYEFALTSSSPTAYITATNPVCVYLYIVGSSCGGSNGDPSSVWISPIEQRIQEVTFGTFSPGQTLTQYINIVTPTAATSSVKLDGSSISYQFSAVPGNALYSYARLSVAHGTHTITSDSGVVAHVYGLGSDESYAYSAGSSVANLKSKMFVNDVSSVDISASQEYCLGDTVYFTSNIQMAYDSIIWQFGDGTSASGNSASHVYPTYGIYLVDMIIDRRSANNNCGGFDTISTVVKILQNDTIIYDTICHGEYYSSNGFALTCNNDTTISKHFATVWGCDSIVTLNLKVNPVYNITLNDDICEGAVYSKYGFTISTQDSIIGLHTYSKSLQTIYGCDSNVTLNLTINQKYDINIYDTICQNLLPYTQYNFNVSQTGTFTKHLTTNKGCDSTVTLHLVVNPTAATSLTASICQGENYNLNGFNVNIAGTHVQHLQTSKGCDSTVTLTLTVNHVYNISLSDVICEGSIYSKNGFTIPTKDSSIGVHTYIKNLKTQNGCDSIVKLSLKIGKNYDIVFYDTVCQTFVPYTLHNFNATQTGTYTQNLTTSTGCDSILTLHLVVNPTKVTNLSASICQGNTYNANGFNESTGGTYTKHLQTDKGCDSTVYLNLTVYALDPVHIPVTLCKGDKYNGYNFSITASAVGHYTYTHVDASVTGCDSTTILNVNVLPDPVPNLGNDIIICNVNKLPVTLYPGHFARYLWSTGDTTQSITTSESGVYSVTVSTQDGCTATDAIEVADHHVDVSIVQGVDFCEGYVTTLTAETDAPYIKWSNGELGQDITVLRGGPYAVTVSNDYCQSSSLINIPECPYELYVPNTISAYQQDGVNDYFCVSGNTSLIEEFKIYIYDRWGHLVYESDDVNFKWDGKVGGKHIPNHTYSWVIHLKPHIGKQRLLKGHVNVL